MQLAVCEQLSKAMCRTVPVQLAALFIYATVFKSRADDDCYALGVAPALSTDCS